MCGVDDDYIANSYTTITCSCKFPTILPEVVCCSLQTMYFLFWWTLHTAMYQVASNKDINLSALRLLLLAVVRTTLGYGLGNEQDSGSCIGVYCVWRG